MKPSWQPGVNTPVVTWCSLLPLLSLPPPTRPPQDCFLLLYVRLHSLEFYIRGIKPCVLFTVWFLSFNIRKSRSIPTVVYCVCLCSWQVSHCMDVPQFVHSVDGHLDFFQFLMLQIKLLWTIMEKSSSSTDNWHLLLNTGWVGALPLCLALCKLWCVY